MNNDDNTYKYLALGVVGILVIYILIKTLSFQGKMVEGLTNQDGSSASSNTSNDIRFLDNQTTIIFQKLKNLNDTASDVLSIDKYRTDYENLLMSLEEISNNMILMKIMVIGDNIASKKDINVDIINNIETVNKLKSFIETLNVSMKYVDRKKSTGSFF